jgi:Na+-transporting NADH:ubiquinone oxidoreductase subunit NqrB
MRFNEIDLLGVYVSPVAVMLVAAWVLLLGVRRVLDVTGLMRHLWHPALAGLAIYVMILSAIAAGAAAWSGGNGAYGG